MCTKLVPRIRNLITPGFLILVTIMLQTACASNIESRVIDDQTPTESLIAEISTQLPEPTNTPTPTLTPSLTATPTQTATHTPTATPVVISETNADQLQIHFSWEGPSETCWKNVCSGVIKFSPDGRLIATASSDNIIRIWRVEDWTLIQELEGHTDRINDIAFSPDSEEIASSSSDATTLVWQIDDGSILNTIESAGGKALAVAYSHSSELLAIANQVCTITLWDFATNAPQDSIQIMDSCQGGRAWSLVFSTDDNFLISASVAGGNNTWRILPLATGVEIPYLYRHTYGYFYDMAISNDGNLTAAVSDAVFRPKVIRFEPREIWDHYEGHTGKVLQVDFSPDGQLLLTGSVDNTVRLWRVIDGENLAILDDLSDWIVSIDFSNRGDYIAALSLDGTFIIWGP